MSHFFVEISVLLRCAGAGTVDFPFKKVTYHVTFLKKYFFDPQDQRSFSNIMAVRPEKNVARHATFFC